MAEQLIPGKPVWNTDLIPCDSDDPLVIPLEHLEARICELAGHLTAAACRFLLLVADFDARGGWASWEMPSCAAWLSWKCQIAPGTAREHVRVARALGEFPVIRAEFAAARLSYAKVRELTRIATKETEKDLVETVLPMTAAQAERFARAHRRVSRGEQDGRPAVREKTLSWRYGESGISISAGLPPADGALVLQALRAYVNDVEHLHHPEDGHGDPPKTRAERLRDLDAEHGTDLEGARPYGQDRVPAEDLAAALVGIAGEYLAGRAAAAENPDNYQVIIHAGTGAVTGTPEPGTAEPGASGVRQAVPQGTRPGESGEPGPEAGKDGGTGKPAKKTPSEQAMAALREAVPLLSFPASHPAYPWRCHVEDGQAIDAATLQMIACNATISTMLHDEDGKILNVGRRTRKPPAALRRAVRERDRYRCRFPGCESRRVDLHHILFWANGGETKLENLICLCKRHHTVIHDDGIIIAATGTGFTFYLPGGAQISSCPPLPGSTAEGITACHDAAVTYSTIVPPHSGDRLDLHEAIWICFHNAKVQVRCPRFSGQGIQ